MNYYLNIVFRDIQMHCNLDLLYHSWDSDLILQPKGMNFYFGHINLNYFRIHQILGLQLYLVPSQNLNP